MVEGYSAIFFTSYFQIFGSTSLRLQVHLQHFEWCRLSKAPINPSFQSHHPHGDGSRYPSHEERDDWRSVLCSQAVPVDMFLHSIHSLLWGTTGWTIDCMVGYSIHPLVVNKRPQNMAHYILLVTWHVNISFLLSNVHRFVPWLIKISSHFHFLKAWELYITLNCVDKSLLCFPVNRSEISFICMFLHNILKHYYTSVCVWRVCGGGFIAMPVACTPLFYNNGPLIGPSRFGLMPTVQHSQSNNQFFTHVQL